MRVAAAVAVLGCLIAAGGARAEPEPAAATPGAQARGAAKMHFQLAERLFQRGQFAAAEVQYKAAYDAWPLEGFFFNIAQCERNQGHVDEAIHYFQRYLESPRADAHRAEVEALLAELKGPRAGAAPPPAPPSPEVAPAPPRSSPPAAAAAPRPVPPAPPRSSAPVPAPPAAPGLPPAERRPRPGRSPPRPPPRPGKPPRPPSRPEPRPPRPSRAQRRSRSTAVRGSGWQQVRPSSWWPVPSPSPPPRPPTVLPAAWARRTGAEPGGVIMPMRLCMPGGSAAGAALALLLAALGCEAPTGVDVEIIGADVLGGDQVRVVGGVEGEDVHASTVPVTARPLSHIEDVHVLVPDEFAGRTLTVTCTVLQHGQPLTPPASMEGRAVLVAKRTKRVVLCFDPSGCP